jgi:Cd2+/Zn2+-exporting ATPase
MAAALVEYSHSRSIRPEPENVTEFHIYHGEGIYGVISGKHIYIGNKKIMDRSSCQARKKTPTNLIHEINFRELA